MRNIKIEGLRVLFMWIIVMLHLLTYGFKYVNATPFVGHDISGMMVPSLLGITKLGVTGFIFISGYYGIKCRANKLASLWCATTFYALASGVAMACFSMGGVKGTVDAPFALFDGWWFIQSYFIVMLISPILNWGFDRITKPQFAAIVILLFILQYGVQWYHCANGGPSFQKFVITYLIGVYLGRYPIPFFQKHSCSLLALSLILLIGLPFAVCYVGHPHLLKWLNTNFNPLCLVVCYCLVLVANKKPLRKKGTFITANVLAVYLIHCSRFGSYLLWKSSWLHYDDFSLTYLFGLTTAVYLACVTIDVLRKRLTSGIENYLTKKLETLFP